MPDKLSAYHAKRNFHLTPEPRGEAGVSADRLRFVVQKHAASSLHYDFRLEFGGTLKSWAVPKGPSLDPSEKRLAVQVEDHPLDYIHFEGVIPARQYGAGKVEVWDTGYWEPDGDPAAAYRDGKLKFRLDGEKLQGGWVLVRTRMRPGNSKPQWLLIKETDDEARDADEFEVTVELPDSVLSGGKGKAAKAAGSAGPGTAEAKKPARGTGKSAAIDPARATGAVQAKLPDLLDAQLATLVDAVPAEGKWEYEIKFDGYRVLARIRQGKAALFTRDGKDWTARLPKQAAALEALKLQDGWLDGEIVALDEHGIPSFQKLQNAFDAKNGTPILYYLFDLPWLNGHDLRAAPLNERRALLERLLDGAPQNVLRYSAAMREPPQLLLDSACRMSMEGIIGKRADSAYTGKRSADWIKLKCRKRQEFVIAGYTDPQGARRHFGSLLLAVYGDDGVLRYAGRVGTGFDANLLETLFLRMKPLRQKESPFAQPPADIPRLHTHWLRPQLVAEISFAEWTREGLLRQAVFHGMREDKPATQIRREEAVPVSGSKAGARAKTPSAPEAPVPPAERRSAKKEKVADGAEEASVLGVRITHPERVIDAASGITKLDLAHYYETVADHILPALRNRPVYLLRAPAGVEGERFFQKHLGRAAIPGVTALDPSIDPEHGAWMSIDAPQGLAGAAQMGAIELHVSGARADRFDRPDCMVFDLDPDPKLAWKRVIEGASLTRALLDELGLQSFLKTSGGKGLHLVVPLARRNDWDTVKDFSEAVARHLEQTFPDRFSATMGEKNRVGEIYVDFLRNQPMASAVAPYSVRARPGLPVATPLDWDELDGLTSAAMWTVANIPDRLAGLRRDPWKGYAETKQSITVAMRRRLGMEK